MVALVLHLVGLSFLVLDSFSCEWCHKKRLIPKPVAWISFDYFESLLLPQLLRGENDSKQSDEFQATKPADVTHLSRRWEIAFSFSLRIQPSFNDATSEKKFHGGTRELWRCEMSAVFVNCTQLFSHSAAGRLVLKKRMHPRRPLLISAH